MYAIYRGQLAKITECMGNPHVNNALVTDPIEALWNMDGVVLDDDMWVSHMDPDLIVDPTDQQVAAAEAGRPVPADPDADAEVMAEARALIASTQRHR